MTGRKLLALAAASWLTWSAADAAESAATAPRHRGFTIDVGRADRATLRELAEKWHVNLIRYHMRSRYLADRRRCSDADAWKEIAAGLPELLDNAREFGITVVLCIQGGPPNDRTRKYPGGRERQAAFWDDDTNRQNLIACWREIAQLCRNRPEPIWFDILNEPLDWRDFPSFPRRWPSWAQDVIDAIRAVDRAHPVVIEVGPGGLCWGFKDFPLLKGMPLIYSVHCYQPHAYSHQGVKNLRGTDLAKAYLQVKKEWPGRFSDGDGGYWDRQRLEKELAPVIAFQKKHGVPIYVGEFSVVRWAPNGDRFLRDNIELFEQYGWDWTYHAFRESHLWDLEKEDAISNYPGKKAAVPTARARTVLEFLQRNRPAAAAATNPPSSSTGESTR